MYLKEWLKVFNKDQILVLRTEDYSANIKETLKTVFNFLQLGKYFHYFIFKKKKEKLLAMKVNILPYQSFILLVFL